VGKGHADVRGVGVPQGRLTITARDIKGRANVAVYLKKNRLSKGRELCMGEGPERGDRVPNWLRSKR